MPKKTKGTKITTILLAEDEPPLRELGEAILTRAGYKVFTAPASEALKSWIEECPAAVDLLVTDVVMPGISGLELVGMAKERWPEIRVLYVSGYPVDQIEGLRREAAFLQKPFTPSEFLSAVAALLGSRG